MNISQMPAKISALRECLTTLWAAEGPLVGVFTEMITKVATLLEDTLAVLEVALEELLNSFGYWVVDFDSLMPLMGLILWRFQVFECFAHFLQTILRHAVFVNFYEICIIIVLGKRFGNYNVFLSAFNLKVKAVDNLISFKDFHFQLPSLYIILFLVNLSSCFHKVRIAFINN
jgi:hypothetical protein